MYFEKQLENENNCFKHALNHYFKKNYFNEDFLGSLSKIQIEMKECHESFFDGEVVENSKNDLYDYYQIHHEIDLRDFIKTISNSKCQELSPNEGIF